MKSFPIALIAALAAAPITASAQPHLAVAAPAAPAAPSRAIVIHTDVPTGAPKIGNGAVVHLTTVSTPVFNSNPSPVNGRVVVAPVYAAPAWGWNQGVVWMPQGAYWGGGFYGPFGPGAATTAEIMGSIIYGDKSYPSYAVNAGSPGAILLSDYGLRQVACGPPGLVVIYGPNFGGVCAYPNGRVAAGKYAFNTSTLTLQSK
jgi:hypothetical protein